MNKAKHEIFVKEYIDSCDICTLNPKPLRHNSIQFLDAGCGTGRDVFFANKLGFKCTGIDLSEEMLTIARSTVANAEFLKRSVMRLGLPRSSFHVIWSSAVLLHFTDNDIRKILKRFHKVLVERGLLFVALEERKPDDKKVFIKESQKGPYTVRRFFNLFTFEEFYPILYNNGFQVLAYGKRGETTSDKQWLWFIAEKVKSPFLIPDLVSP